MAFRKKTDPLPVAPAVVSPQDLHWAMHAVVSACPRERYDAMPLRQIPKGSAGKGWDMEIDTVRAAARRKPPQTVPIFGPANG